MVSTRLMSSCGGGTGSGEGAGSLHAEPAAVPRVTRHSSAQLPGGSSPHAGYATRGSLVPAPRAFDTDLLDMPLEIQEKIFCYTGFKTISHIRMVS